jgi:hypothetical protein
METVFKIQKKRLRVIKGVNYGASCRSIFSELCNTDRCKKSVINMGIKIFNGLPLELKTIENFKVFKKKLKNYLICNEFYSHLEFFNQCD